MNKNIGFIQKWERINETIKEIVGKDKPVVSLDEKTKIDAVAINVANSTLLIAGKVHSSDYIGVIDLTDIVSLVFGIPIYLLGLWIWVKSYKRFFLGSKILIKYDKLNKIKEWQEVRPYPFSNYLIDSKPAWMIVHGISLLVWSIIWIAIIFT